jgi:hypothetical protein
MERRWRGGEEMNRSAVAFTKRMTISRVRSLRDFIVSRVRL